MSGVFVLKDFQVKKAHAQTPNILLAQVGRIQNYDWPDLLELHFNWPRCILTPWLAQLDSPAGVSAVIRNKRSRA